MKLLKTIISIIIASLLAGCDNQPNSSSVKPSFDSTLSIHLTAIRNSNLIELAPTVGDSVILISPDGEKMHSKEKFMNLHENWFREKNWQWTAEVLKKESTDSMGYALLRYLYTVNDSTGKLQFENKNYLLLIFKNSRDGWRLIHDQNTIQK